MDRKIREDSIYSRECIIDAFLLILSEKNLQDITVTELCKKAGVARITFYKYYKTINDVLKATVDYKFKEFKVELNNAPHNSDLKHSLHTFVALIRSMHKPLESLAKANMSGILLQYFTDAFLTLFPSVFNNEDYSKAKYLFLSGGIFNILSEWNATGMKESTKQIADYIYVSVSQFLKN